MRSSYIIRMPDGQRIAIADVSKVRMQVYEINRINVPERWRGLRYGTQLLQQVCDDANRCNVTLRLVPLESGGMSTEELEAWYTRRGFERHHNGYFYRPPYIYRHAVGEGWTSDTPERRSVEELLTWLDRRNKGWDVEHDTDPSESGIYALAKAHRHQVRRKKPKP